MAARTDPDVMVRRLVVAAVVVAVAFAGFVWVLLAGSGGERPDGIGRVSLDPSDNPLVGEPLAPGTPAPTTSFATLDGGTASIVDYAGRPLVVNFFGSWCAPCIAEMPAIEEVHRRHAGTIAFLGLAVRDRAEDAAGIVERTGVTYDIGLDPAVELHAAFGGYVMPATALVSADGRILHVHQGELDAARLERLIGEHLRP